MLLPRGIDVKKMNRLVEELRKAELWAERHSYSIRIMYKGRIVASLHLYPGYNEAVLKLYSDETSVNDYVLSSVKRVLASLLPEVVVRAEVLQPFKLVP
ncbi:MAG: hypothetical protein ACP5KA_01640 [Desulfurococcaceae archaeon]